MPSWQPPPAVQNRTPVAFPWLPWLALAGRSCLGRPCLWPVPLARSSLALSFRLPGLRGRSSQDQSGLAGTGSSHEQAARPPWKDAGLCSGHAGHDARDIRPPGYRCPLYGRGHAGEARTGRERRRQPLRHAGSCSGWPAWCGHRVPPIGPCLRADSRTADRTSARRR